MLWGSDDGVGLANEERNHRPGERSHRRGAAPYQTVGENREGYGDHDGRECAHRRVSAHAPQLVACEVGQPLLIHPWPPVARKGQGVGMREAVVGDEAARVELHVAVGKQHPRFDQRDGAEDEDGDGSCPGPDPRRLLGRFSGERKLRRLLIGEMLGDHSPSLSATGSGALRGFDNKELGTVPPTMARTVLIRPTGIGSAGRR